MHDNLHATISRYADVLHKFGVGSPQAQDFKRAHAGDLEFCRRAKATEKFYKRRDKIVEVVTRLRYGTS